MNQKLLTKQLINLSTKYLPDDIAVSVRSVSKKFCRNLRRSMAYGIADLSKNLVGIKSDSASLRKDEFWALQDISFDMKTGEILGIIGANGSGKTTLLRLITGIFPPDKGEIIARGRIGALIALGAGFHPHMTGKENIYLNGSILGMSHEEIDTKFNDIVEFSEIDDFLDAPVSTYSSGMKVRIGFSIAVHIEPEIVVIDEVLAVGDASFRSKSYERMLSFKERGSNICFVSHDLMAIEAICDRVIWLDKGKIMMQGAPIDVIPAYREAQDRHLLVRRQPKQYSNVSETGEIIISKCETLNQNHSVTNEFKYKDRLIVRIHYDAKIKVKKPYFMVYIISGQTEACIFNANMLRDGGEPDELEGEGWLDIDFGPLNLYPNVYQIRAQIRKFSAVEYFSLREVASFVVVSKPQDYKVQGPFAATYVRDSSALVIPVEFRWSNQNENLKKKLI